MGAAQAPMLFALPLPHRSRAEAGKCGAAIGSPALLSYCGHADEAGRLFTQLGAGFEL